MKFKKINLQSVTSTNDIAISLIKKNEHTYRQKRKTFEDIMSRFSGRGYNFGSVGRYKFNLKVDLVKNSKMNVNSRFYGVRLAEDVVSPKDSKIKIEKETIIEQKQIIDLTRITDDELGRLKQVLTKATTTGGSRGDEKVIEGVYKK